MRKALPIALRPVVTFGYLTGWRVRSEVLPLEWNQVDREAKLLRLHPGSTKNGQGREVGYGDNAELCELIDAQWQLHEQLQKSGTISPLVFPRQTGKRIKSFRGAWIVACEAAGCPGRLVHDLRRTAVRNLVRAGVSEKTAMTVTGHKTRSVFDRYDIVNTEDTRAALGKLSTVTVSGTVPTRGKVRRMKRPA